MFLRNVHDGGLPSIDSARSQRIHMQGIERSIPEKQINNAISLCSLVQMLSTRLRHAWA